MPSSSTDNVNGPSELVSRTLSPPFPPVESQSVLHDLCCHSSHIVTRSMLPGTSAAPRAAAAGQSHFDVAEGDFVFGEFDDDF